MFRFLWKLVGVFREKHRFPILALPAGRLMDVRPGLVPRKATCFKTRAFRLQALGFFVAFVAGAAG